MSDAIRSGGFGDGWCEVLEGRGLGKVKCRAEWELDEYDGGFMDGGCIVSRRGCLLGEEWREKVAVSESGDGALARARTAGCYSKISGVRSAPGGACLGSGLLAAWVFEVARGTVRFQRIRSVVDVRWTGHGYAVPWEITYGTWRMSGRKCPLAMTTRIGMGQRLGWRGGVCRGRESRRCGPRRYAWDQDRGDPRARASRTRLSRGKQGWV